MGVTALDVQFQLVESLGKFQCLFDEGRAAIFIRFLTYTSTGEIRPESDRVELRRRLVQPVEEV